MSGRIRLAGERFRNASGTGSWPGTAARQAAEIVVGELGAAMAHIVELPARGVGADIVGRAGALLIDVAIDTVPRGYRVSARPGKVTRRAVSLLDEDIDALEEAWETAGLRGNGRPVKIQAPGPITLAAELSWRTDTGRSPISAPCRTSRPRWPKGSPRIGPRCPVDSIHPWWCNSTSRRWPRRWPGGWPG